MYRIVAIAGILLSAAGFGDPGPGPQRGPASSSQPQAHPSMPRRETDELPDVLIRARAYKPGFTRSIVVQETLIIAR